MLYDFMNGSILYAAACYVDSITQARASKLRTEAEVAESQRHSEITALMVDLLRPKA